MAVWTIINEKHSLWEALPLNFLLFRTSLVSNDVNRAQLNMALLSSGETFAKGHKD